MSLSGSSVSISDIDTNRFGILTARAILSSDSLLKTVEFCKSKTVKLLIARCPVSEIHLVHQMLYKGFHLMDTIAYYSRDLINRPIPAINSLINIRPAQPGEEYLVKKLAVESFAGYVGHYHCDDRLDRDKCDEIYPDWAYRSCISKSVADEVLIAAENKHILGFLTLRRNNNKETEGLLNAVLPAAQKRGIYPELLIHGLMWSLELGAEVMMISTQLSNRNPQKVWTRIGFEISDAFYTFHKWFDE